MRSTIFSAMALAFAAVAEASFSSPKSGDKWAAGESQMITWDKSTIDSTVSIYLAPAGATDTSNIISKIATGVSNSGIYPWKLDSSIAASEAEIILVSSSTTIISGSFTIISIGSSHGSSGSHGSGSHGSGSKNSTHDSGKTKGHGGSYATTSLITISVNGSYYTQSTVFTTTQVTTTVPGAAATTSLAPAAATTSVAPAAAETTVPPPAAASSSVSSGTNSSTSIAVNATPTGITFTGSASSQNTVYTVVGCVAGFAAIMLL